MGVGLGEEEQPPVTSLETFREMQGHQPALENAGLG